MYITRAEARALHNAEPDVDDTWTFQGDIFHSLELMARRPGGLAEFPVTWGIAISHHCEWTKAIKRPNMDYPILVAPLRELAAFSPGDNGLITNNRMRAYMHLPADPPVVDRDLVADLRFTQPIAAADLVGADYVASLGQELWQVLQAKVVEFIVRDRTRP